VPAKNRAAFKTSDKKSKKEKQEQEREEQNQKSARDQNRRQFVVWNSK
jgi:hypothetical protein